MSRAIVHEPVVTQVTTTKIATPAPTLRISVALEPVSHQFTGTQTAEPEMPSN